VSGHVEQLKTNEKGELLVRRVVVEVKTRIVLYTPIDNTPESIEFFLNDSCSCSDNIFRDIASALKVFEDDEDEIDDTAQCACQVTHCKYIGEAKDKGENEGAIELNDWSKHKTLEQLEVLKSLQDKRHIPKEYKLRSHSC